MTKKINKEKKKKHNAKDKKSNKKNIVNNNNFKKTDKIKIKFIVKILLIIFIILVYAYVKSSYENQISLLAVTENNNKIIGGNIINLSLKVTPGTGKTFVNMNTIEAVDTEVSIINSQKIACKIFNLDCSHYNFYYDFKTDSTLLKGPSASAAIAILTAKTLKHEKIKDDTVITGALFSEGLIGNVGGINEKINVAINHHFKKILIPYFEKINKSKINKNKIKIVRVLDLVSAYNQFYGKNFTPKKYKINTSVFNQKMKNLALNICKKSETLKSNLNKSWIKKINNSEINSIYNEGNKTLNYGKETIKTGDYYSAGSFCYNSIINFRILDYYEQFNFSPKLKNLTNINLTEVNKEAFVIKNKIETLQNKINSKEFQNNIKTTNDFYIYSILVNRIYEADKNYDNFYKSYSKLYKLINQKNEINITNISNSSKINNTNKSINKNIKINDKITKEQKIKYYLINSIYYLSVSKERYYTVLLWEKFLTHTGKKIKINKFILNKGCDDIIREINLKNALLNYYNINLFSKEINNLQKFTEPDTNKYLCIYNGLELNAKINTILNTIALNKNESKIAALKLLNFSYEKLSENSKEGLPFIPYMYLQYSKDLLRNGDSSTSLLYINYALSYMDLDMFISQNKINLGKEIFLQTLSEVFNKPIFWLGILLFIGFI